MPTRYSLDLALSPARRRQLTAYDHWGHTGLFEDPEVAQAWPLEPVEGQDLVAEQAHAGAVAGVECS